MMRWLTGVAALALLMSTACAGCKGETSYKDSPDTVERLQSNQNEIAEKKKLITMLQAELSELKANGSGDQFFVTLDGELEIKARGGSRRPAKNVDVEAQAKAFYKHVSSAQSAVRRCYQNALKKDSSLTAKTIKLNVKVSYGTNGKVANVGMDKKISPIFSACLKGVARNWKVPPPPKKVTFSQTFALTPQ